MHEVARRARSPVGGGIRQVQRLWYSYQLFLYYRIRRRSKPRSKDGASEASDESFDSCGSLFSSLNDYKDIEKDKNGNNSLPKPAQYTSPGKSEFSEDKQQKRTQVFRHHTKLSEGPGIYSFSTPPFSLPNMTRRSALPIDYKAPVATLPYIAGDNVNNTPKYEDVVTNLAVNNLIDQSSPTNIYSIGESSL